MPVGGTTTRAAMSAYHRAALARSHRTRGRGARARAVRERGAAPEHKAGGGASDPTGERPAEREKQALIIGLLSRDEGATLADITAATGWLRHGSAALTGLRQKGTL